jgi:hypothetical protein
MGWGRPDRGDEKGEAMSGRKSVWDFLTSPGPGWRGVLVPQMLALVFSILSTLIGIVTQNSIPWLIASMAVMVLILWGVFATRRRSKPLELVPKWQQPNTYPGLIVIVGPGRPEGKPQDQSARDAIQYHMSPVAGSGLRHCWMITPANNQRALQVASDLKEWCQSVGVDADVLPVNDSFDLKETYDLVRRVRSKEAAKVGLDAWQVIADFTGGTKPMGAGVVLACGQEWPMQYMYGRAEGVASTPRRIEFKPQT